MLWLRTEGLKELLGFGQCQAESAGSLRGPAQPTYKRPRRCWKY
jgi:hypothetical protein